MKLLEKIFFVKNETKNSKKYKVLNLFGMKFSHKIGYVEVEDINFSEICQKYGQEFAEIYSKIRPYTMITEEAAFLNYQMIDYIENNNIEGDIVECGVWKGGSSMLMALTLIAKGNTSRKIYMYDTYEGMSEPTKEDITVLNENASEWFQQQKER